MREFLETFYGVRVIRWAEWDGECEQFSILRDGELILADSLALLMAELASRVPALALAA